MRYTETSLDWFSSSQHKLPVQIDTCLASVNLPSSMSKQQFCYLLPPELKLRWLKEMWGLDLAKFEMYNNLSLEIMLMSQPS